ncbi:MAG: O-antigen ligase family protein [bacterium]|nr:O-antigen ligase family protein [bacterium]
MEEIKDVETKKNNKTFIIDKIIYFLLLLYAISSSVSIAASEVFLGLGLITWIIKLIKSRAEGLSHSPLDIPLLAFVLCRIISTFAGINIGSSMGKMKEILLFFVIYMAQFNLDSEKFLGIVKVMIYATAFAAVARIIHMYIILDLPFNLDHRLNGFTGGYMTYGSIISISILLGTGILFFSNTKKHEKILLGTSLFFLLIALTMTMTRSAWTGFLFGLGFLGIFKKRIILVIVGAIVIAGLFFAPAKIKTRAFSMFTPKDMTTYSRLKMWNWGIKVFKDYPVLGIGPNNVNKLRYTEWRKYPLEPIIQDDMVHQHNNFMQVLVTLGGLGFLIFLWLIFSFFKIFIKALMQFKLHPDYGGLIWGVNAVFISFIITGLFEYNFFDSEISLIIFFLTGGVLSLQKENASH